MYCPKCGQSQVSAEVRFCSRCGFPLLVVGEVLATGGVFPVQHASAMEGGVRPISPRRRGVKHGIALLLVSIFMLPFFAILHEAVGLPDDFMALSLIVAMAAILRLIYAAFFEDAAPRMPHFAAPPQPYTPPIASRLQAPGQESLPAAQHHGGAAVNDYRQPQVHTAEIMRPPSVTDHTTRLLDKQIDSPEQ
jgi:hypothetical protein